MGQEQEREKPGLNQLVAENPGLIGALVDPTCLYLLCLVGHRHIVSLAQIEADYRFKTGTAGSWMQRLVNAGLVDGIDDSSYRLSASGEMHVAPMKKEMGKSSSLE